MAQNKILPWAQTSTANALSDADYATDVARGGSYADGVKSGQASSKQANKTWRQATAPGSGLAQFLVDNLSVDVTDADTPSTFSTRIANAVLKLAQISPFNQSWATATGGYRKYAIVSDSSGNFWVSTADQNTTVPGDSGAKWQSLFDGYATNPALNTEITNRTNADTNLQNQINNRVMKSGDTMTGPLTTQSPKTASTGQYNYSPNFTAKNIDGAEANFFAQELVGAQSALVLRLRYSGADRGYWWFNEDGNIGQSSKGNVLFASDAAAMYATFAYAQGTVRSSGYDWFWMKLPNGWIIQGGNASYYAADGTTGTTIKLPTSFGTQFVIAIGNDIGFNANAVTVMRIDASTIRLLGREVTSGTLQDTAINYLCIGTAP